MNKHYVLALDGTAQQISSVLASGPNKRRSTVWMQPRVSNLNPVFLGTDNTITSTNYGVRLPAPSAGDPPPPFNPGEFDGSPEKYRSPIRMSDFWVKGTAGEFLHLLVVDF